jgi:hypothetical protein
MATCDTCGTTILFGGVKNGDTRFCNATCAQRGALLASSLQVAESEVEREARAIHQGKCPKCQGPGPVDMHVSHYVYSFLVMTRWSSKPDLCCRSCGREKQLAGAVTTLFTGWWGFPWGLIMTPIQIGKNVSGVLGMAGPDPSTPSPALYKAVRLTMAARQNPTSAASGQTFKPA